MGAAHAPVATMATGSHLWHVPAPGVPTDGTDLRVTGPTGLARISAAISARPLLWVLTLALSMGLIGGAIGGSIGYSTGRTDVALGASGASASPPSSSHRPLSPSLSATISHAAGASASSTASLTSAVTPPGTRSALPVLSDGAKIHADAARYMVTGQRVSLLGLGDWGQCADNSDPVSRSVGLNCMRQRSLVNAMEAWMNASSAAAVISVGDNFYHGVDSDSDARWSYSWREIYNTPLLRKKPWLVIQVRARGRACGRMDGEGLPTSAPQRSTPRTLTSVSG